jgi:hypothetical protein
VESFRQKNKNSEDILVFIEEILQITLVPVDPPVQTYLDPPVDPRDDLLADLPAQTYLDPVVEQSLAAGPT